MGGKDLFATPNPSSLWDPGRLTTYEIPPRPPWGCCGHDVPG